MTNRIVPIPWQPDLLLRESTLALLDKASDRYGARLQIRRPDGALRSFARQLYYWLLWLAGKGPVASNPYTGPRFHMRGAAFDLLDPNTRARKACLAVGLLPDPIEGWHFNDPNWASIPIVVLAPASSTATLITGEEPTMQLVQIKDVSGKPLYTFDGHTFVPIPQGQGGMFTALLGGPTKVSQSTFNAATIQGKRHLELE